MELPVTVLLQVYNNGKQDQKKRPNFVSLEGRFLVEGLLALVHLLILKLC